MVRGQVKALIQAWAEIIGAFKMQSHAQFGQTFKDFNWLWEAIVAEAYQHSSITHRAEVKQHATTWPTLSCLAALVDRNRF